MCGIGSGAEAEVVRRIQCNLAELADAFDDAGMSVFLDLDTGEVIHVTAAVRERVAGGLSDRASRGDRLMARHARAKQSSPRLTSNRCATTFS